MPDLVWPTVLDDSQVLIGALGTFWANTYQGKELVKSYLAARARLDRQTFLNLAELLSSLSRFTLPLLHTEDCRVLTLLQSAGDDSVPGQFAWALPPGLVSCPLIANRLTGASLNLVSGDDFSLQNGFIRFREDPFENPLFAVTPLLQNGQVVDNEVTLWLRRSRWDQQRLTQQFGYVLNLDLPSTPQGQALLNTLFDALVGGSTMSVLARFFAALCAVPCAQGSETVAAIFTSDEQLWIVTDQQAYAAAQDSTVVVAAGEAVSAGQFLTDTVEFFETPTNVVPSAFDIAGVTLDHGFLPYGYHGSLTFANQELPLTVIDAAGRSDHHTFVSFPLGGLAADTVKFFNDLQTNGIAAGQTLAALLDQHVGSLSGRSEEYDLPDTINPFGFLLQNVYRGNLLLVKLRPTLFGAGALGLGYLSRLRTLLPPGTACIVQVDVTPSSLSVVFGGSL